MEQRKQTAVDFLLHELSEIVGVIAPDAFSASLMKIKYEQAKEMEKEQHKLTWERGSYSLLDCGSGEYFEDYYNETYNKQ